MRPAAVGDDVLTILIISRIVLKMVFRKLHLVVEEQEHRPDAHRAGELEGIDLRGPIFVVGIIIDAEGEAELDADMDIDLRLGDLDADAGAALDADLDAEGEAVPVIGIVNVGDPVEAGDVGLFFVRGESVKLGFGIRSAVGLLRRHVAEDYDEGLRSVTVFCILHAGLLQKDDVRDVVSVGGDVARRSPCHDIRVKGFARFILTVVVFVPKLVAFHIELALELDAEALVGGDKPVLAVRVIVAALERHGGVVYNGVGAVLIDGLALAGEAGLQRHLHVELEVDVEKRAEGEPVLEPYFQSGGQDDRGLVEHERVVHGVVFERDGRAELQGELDGL